MGKAITTFIAAGVLAVMPVNGHHSFQADFDWKKPTTLLGSVTKVEWANDGWFAKDGSKRLSAKSVTLSDGRELFAGSSFFEMRKTSDDGS